MRKWIKVFENCKKWSVFDLMFFGPGFDILFHNDGFFLVFERILYQLFGHDILSLFCVRLIVVVVIPEHAYNKQHEHYYFIAQRVCLLIKMYFLRWTLTAFSKISPLRPCVLPFHTGTTCFRSTCGLFVWTIGAFRTTALARRWSLCRTCTFAAGLSGSRMLISPFWTLIVPFRMGCDLDAVLLLCYLQWILPFFKNWDLTSFSVDVGLTSRIS